MKCVLCSEINVGPDHEMSEKHLKNRALHDYRVNGKILSENRKGIVLKCSVSSSVMTVTDCLEQKIKISTKPDEPIKFYFNLSNESQNSCIFVSFIQVPPNKMNFIMNDHNLGYGCAKACLKPKTLLKQEIYVNFKSADIGEYNMPIIFSCYKDHPTDTIYIIREMTVYVERNKVIHEKELSPYSNKQVMATTLIKTNRQNNSDADDEFHIPRNYKQVYAAGLEVGDNAPEHMKTIAEDIKDIFKTGLTKDNYIRFFHNLLWYEETVVRINLKKYNMTGVLLEKVVGDCLKLFVPGLGEKRPSLMLGDLLFVKPQSTDDFMFEAVISDIADNYINIRGFDAKFWKYYGTEEMFDIRFFMSRLPLERMHLAVDSVIRSGQITRVFPEKKVPKKIGCKTNTIDNYFNPLVEYNPEQRMAVEHIVAGSNGTAPYLLHGPPGTGKTVTIVEAILQLVKKNKSYRILVCTDSNMAADHVATLLIRYAHLCPPYLLLRASSKYRVWETLPECLMKFSNGMDYYNFEPVSIKDFLSYRIIVTTLSHAAKFVRQFNVAKEKRPITHLFIDEAAQASEPACLIPLCGLLQKNGSLVLAGDPLQLGPVVISNNARQLGLGLSLMERLMDTCPLYSAQDEKHDANYTVMLRNNFRSDADILHIPNQLFYNGQLRALAAVDKLSSKDILGQKLECRAIVFHGVLSQEQKMGKSPSFFNNMEMEIVQMYIMLLMKDHGVLAEDIGIVTPYIRQVYKIKAWLQKENLQKLEVGTVEAFQGKEKRVIIVSTVRANCGLLDYDAKFKLGFLVDDKRFNVALTRAKAKAIIIGNPLCLEKDLKWRTYMQRCRELGSYVGFDAHAQPAPDAAAQRHVLRRLAPALRDLALGRGGL